METRIFYRLTKKASSLVIALDTDRQSFAYKLLELGQVKTKTPPEVVCPSSGLCADFYVKLSPKIKSLDQEHLDFWWTEFSSGTLNKFNSLEFKEYFVLLGCQARLDSGAVVKEIDYQAQKWNKITYQWEPIA
jgi:hypothetical protein